MVSALNMYVKYRRIGRGVRTMKPQITSLTQDSHMTKSYLYHNVTMSIAAIQGTVFCYHDNFAILDYLLCVLLSLAQNPTVLGLRNANKLKKKTTKEDQFWRSRKVNKDTMNVNEFLGHCTVAFVSKVP